MNDNVHLVTIMTVIRVNNYFTTDTAVLELKTILEGNVKVRNKIVYLKIPIYSLNTIE